jgi:hypothetical protein
LDTLQDEFQSTIKKISHKASNSKCCYLFLDSHVEKEKYKKNKNIYPEENKKRIAMRRGCQRAPRK